MVDYLIFTDLDGSLLNHDDYSFDEAKEILGFLKSKDIPLVFTTSKTKLECQELQKDMDIQAPFIVENGACIYYPDGKVELLGVEIEKIKTFLDQFDLLSFSKMSVKEIVKYTDLSYDQAKYAKDRAFTEPFLLDDESKLILIKNEANKHGLKILKGGRFYHCVGKDQDKGKAVRKVKRYYPYRVTVALGDSYNDIDMLKEVQIPILIPNCDGDFIDFDIPNLLKAPASGSFGWSKALREVLKDV
jgi:mannosyl-3-phosphoglycerate phosphatase